MCEIFQINDTYLTTDPGSTKNTKRINTSISTPKHIPSACYRLNVYASRVHILKSKPPGDGI